MKKFFKWLIIVIVVLVILFFATIFIVAKTIDLNKYKGKIEQSFYQQTGHKLSIKGNLAWSFFPSVSIATGEIDIANLKGYPQDANFASIKSAKFSIELLPLVFGSVDIETVSAQGAHINLIQKSATENNWSASVSKADKKPAVAGKKDSAKSQSQDDDSQRSQGNANFGSFSMSVLNIKDGALTFDNQVNGQVIKLTNVSLQSKGVGIGKTFPISATFNLTRNKPALSVKTKIKANLLLSNEPQMVKLSDLVAQINQSKVTGQVELKNFKLPEITANVKLDKMDVAPYLAMKDTKIPLQNVSLKADLYSVDPQNMGVKSLSLSAKLAGYQQDTRKYSMTDFSLLTKNVKEGVVFPVTIAFVGSLPQSKAPLKTHIQMNAIFDTKKQIARMGELLATVNDSRITGDANLTGFEKPHFTAKLDADQVDVSDYVNIHGAKLPAKDIAINANLAAQGWAAKQLPSTLNGTINLEVGQATIKGFDIADMLTALRNVFKQLVQKKNVAGAMADLKSAFPQTNKAKQINPNNGKETNIGRFIFAGNVKNGVIENHDLKLTGSRFQMKGDGTINLNDQSLNYLVYAFGTHYEEANGQKYEVADPVELPIKIKGKFSDIQYGIDMPKLSKSIQKAVLKQVQDQVKESIQDKIKDKAGDLLKNLKGGVKGLFN